MILPPEREKEIREQLKAHYDCKFFNKSFNHDDPEYMDNAYDVQLLLSEIDSLRVWSKELAEKLAMTVKALEWIAKDRDLYHEPSSSWHLANMALNTLNNIRGDDVDTC